MAEQVAKKKPVDALKAIMAATSVQDQFKNALGENANSFVASLIDLYNTDKSLQECNPNQVVSEALRAAVLKLPIIKALGYAYIIPFKIKGVLTPVFMVGYKGLIQLAMRTGQYRYINADVVYEGEISSRDKLTGAINFDGKKKSDKVVGYFAHIELLNGFQKTLYADVLEIAKHAKKYSPLLRYDKRTPEELAKLAGKDATGIGWTGDFDSMALKTVLRDLLSKYGYLSIEMMDVVSKDKELDYQTQRDNAVEDVEIVEVSMEQVTEEGEKIDDVQQQQQEEQPPY